MKTWKSSFWRMTALLARAICHECDHLDGLMYVSKVEGELMDVEPIEEEEEELE